jgi:hypothetical protein
VLSVSLQVTEHICKLAKKGMTPSQIGVLLRDSHGIPQVCTCSRSNSSTTATHAAHSRSLHDGMLVGFVHTAIPAVHG